MNQEKGKSKKRKGQQRNRGYKAGKEGKKGPNATGERKWMGLLGKRRTKGGRLGGH